MLTARDEEVDRVLGLELGADDYVPKPFSPRELVARVKAVLRRTQPRPPGDVLALGDVELRRGAREATSSGAALDLTMKEFDLLACFLEHAGLALSREQLLEQVWGLEFPGGTRTVDQHVAQLRAKLATARCASRRCAASATSWCGRERGGARRRAADASGCRRPRHFASADERSSLAIAVGDRRGLLLSACGCGRVVLPPLRPGYGSPLPSVRATPRVGLAGWPVAS